VTLVDETENSIKNKCIVLTKNYLLCWLQDQVYFEYTLRIIAKVTAGIFWAIDGQYLIKLFGSAV